LVLEEISLEKPKALLVLGEMPWEERALKRRSGSHIPKARMLWRQFPARISS